MSVASSTVTMRGLPGAKTKPSASAPSAIARSASFSVVMPQILTNIACHRSVGSLSLPLYRYRTGPGSWWTVVVATATRPRRRLLCRPLAQSRSLRRRLGIDQAAVQVVVVRRAGEEPVAAEGEQEHALVARPLSSD